MTWKRFLVERLIVGIILVFTILTINFVLVRIAPGDPIVYMVSGMGYVAPDIVESLRRYYGLDQPIYIQYIRYLERMVQGDFGYSYSDNQPILPLITDYVGATMMIMIPSLLISTLLGTLLGVVASNRPNSRFDNLVQLASLVGYSIPEFWLAIIFILLFTVTFHIFPITTAVDSSFGTVLLRMAPPVIVLTISRLALYARLTRANMLEVFKKDYITTARSKGCSERAVMYKHALRNALLPTVTILGMQIPTLFAGALSVEIVFNWPGIGFLAYRSLMNRDYNMVTAIFFFSSVLVILGTTLSDIIYAYLDPRIRYGKRD